jgi:hypothetical protein
VRYLTSETSPARYCYCSLRAMGRRIDLDPDGHSPAPILGSRLLTCDSACRITAIPGLSQLALLWTALFLCSQCACRLAAKTCFPHPSCALHKAPTYDACVRYLASLSFSGLSFQLPRLNLSFFLFATNFSLILIPIYHRCAVRFLRGVHLRRRT